MSSSGAVNDTMAVNTGTNGGNSMTPENSNINDNSKNRNQNSSCCCCCGRHHQEDINQINSLVHHFLRENVESIPSLGTKAEHNNQNYAAFIKALEGHVLTSNKPSYSLPSGVSFGLITVPQLVKVGMDLVKLCVCFIIIVIQVLECLKISSQKILP